jgi:membrane protein YqaA with SNARE-associated domain
MKVSTASSMRAVFPLPSEPLVFFMDVQLTVQTVSLAGMSRVGSVTGTNTWLAAA